MKIIGTGSALPKKVVTNDMISEFLDTSDAWIFPRTGIRSRHVISDEKLEDLGAEAAEKAIENSGLVKSDIDYFICSNVVSEYITPGLSCVISEKLGLTCPCIDVNCACPGFIYAMDIAENRYLAGKARNILIVCAEEPTRMSSWEDRSTCVLFGDGAGAAVFSEGNNLKGIRLNSNPAPDKIYQYRKLVDTPFIKKEEQDVPLQMKGRDVFKFAVTASNRDILALLEENNLTKNDVSYYMIHQANARIIDAIRDYLEEPESKFPTNISDHGNSSSASCPILLDECNRKGMFKSGDILVFSAFGAGLLSAAAIIEW
ncbi:MAG: ketoacyl-ACP synthase III [Bacteroidales bacterium]|jgi:3-oxoacyl-[acyl-carrier-protein] synthase-3|nr:ketoacyl-ACP synthase III [Bacteroidales bacterium]MCI1785431.1 ketoacyl-ACP synthase III [Bacteroidales bacterium]